MPPSSAKSQFKGAIFEWFIKGILTFCGFRKVSPDGLVVYKGSSGIMVHGLGQPHNIDVLMKPPFQIPFYFPSRLAVECKAYENSIVGLQIARAALGLREDLNNFEIVTPTILSDREKARRKHISNYPFDRYQYNVALATIVPITIPAQEFALTHKIPVLSMYKSTRYSFFRTFLSNITDDFITSLGDRIGRIFEQIREDNFSFNYEDNREFKEFLDASKDLFKHMYIGVTEKGDILFLYNTNEKFVPTNLEYSTKIHWNEPTSEWMITLMQKDEEKQFYFELPNYIYDAWADTEFDKAAAIDFKEKIFKRISVFSVYHNELIFFIMNLDAEFIKSAKNSLKNN
jgi:hypothetical protein